MLALKQAHDMHKHNKRALPVIFNQFFFEEQCTMTTTSGLGSQTCTLTQWHIIWHTVVLVIILNRHSSAPLANDTKETLAQCVWVLVINAHISLITHATILIDEHCSLVNSEGGAVLGDLFHRPARVHSFTGACSFTEAGLCAAPLSLNWYHQKGRSRSNDCSQTTFEFTRR